MSKDSRRSPTRLSYYVSVFIRTNYLWILCPFSSAHYRPHLIDMIASSKSESNDTSGPGKSTKPVAPTPATVAHLVEPRQPCRVTVTAPGWHGAKAAAIAAGCSSVSDMIEKLGRGELAIITNDAIESSPSEVIVAPPILPATAMPSQPQSVPGSPQHVHYHGVVSSPVDVEESDEKPRSLVQTVITGVCAVVIVGSTLYAADRVLSMTSGLFGGLFTEQSSAADRGSSPATGDFVAGYRVSDEYGIRPFHPVTGVPNSPHNGVDLAMPIGTPIYAVGKAGDTVQVKCWQDTGGGGYVVDQTAESYLGYVFQSLHMSGTGCKEGEAKAGDAIAYSGNSGIGTGAHYDFRVKIDGAYVPPERKYLESAVTGEPPQD